MAVSWIKIKPFASAVLITAPSLMLFSPNRSEAIGTMRDSGSDIFKTRCAVCHGVDGSGHTTEGKKLKTPDLRSDEVHQTWKGRNAGIPEEVVSGEYSAGDCLS